MSILSQQIGPLPGGAWIALVGGAVGVSYLARRKGTAAASSTPVPATTATDASSQGAVQYADALTGLTTYGTTAPATNEEWATQAIAFLVGNGRATATAATNAISHVLYPDVANPTSSGDSLLYDAATAAIGPPPSLPTQAYIPPPPPGTDSLINPNLQAGQLSGSGYYSPGITTESSGSYAYIPDQPTAAALLSAGQDLYFEPSPGLFVKQTPTTQLLAGTYGTPLYAKRS